MPPRTPKACRKRGCKQTTTDRSGYCDDHRGESWRQYKPGVSRHQRGYGASWDKTRLRILKRDRGLCQECLRRGAITEAATGEVAHQLRAPVTDVALGETELPVVGTITWATYTGVSS